MTDASHRSHPQTRSRARAITAVAALLLAVAAPRVYAQVRIGVVDIRRAIAESAEGRAASDVIRERYENRQQELSRRTRDIETLKRSLERPRAPIPPARLQKMAQQYQRQVMELQQLGQQYTQELQGMEGSVTKAILSRMQPIVREVGQSDNFQLIIDEQVVHFAPAHLNLTDRVVQLYNQRFPADAGAIRSALLDAAAQVENASQQQGGPGPGPGPGPSTGPSTPATAMDAGTAPSTSTGDAGRRVVPSVFFRRDGGAQQ